MRMLIKNHLDNAWESLRTNKLRTFLTITGSVIGTASIAMVLSLAGGATNFFEQHIVSISESTALIRSSTASRENSLFYDAHSLSAASTLTEKDAQSIQSIDDLVSAPMAILQTSFTARDGSVDGSHATLIGSSMDLVEVADLEVAEGQFFTSNANTSGIVMGRQLAIDVFGSERAIGNLITIRGQNFTVIGVLKGVNQPVNHLGVDIDQSAIVTVASIKQFTQNVAQIQQIIFKSNTTDKLANAISQVEERLSENHLGEKDYVVLAGGDIATANRQYIDSITLLVTIVAGVALFVGGVGIMNIMLVNVAERNREVGIRKAIGASNGQIVNQFLIESTIIGMTGGVVGTGVGVGLAYLASYYLPFAPSLDWTIAAICIGASTAIGVIFGLYPALRAARKDPITALRQ